MQPDQMHHRLAPGHERVCFVHTKMTPAACALQEFTEAPLRILKVSGLVDIGIPIAASSPLVIAASCLISWLAAIFTQTVSTPAPAFTCQLTEAHCKMILFWRCAWHCIMAQQTCAITNLLALLCCSSMVPGQLEILPMGQTYLGRCFKTPR